MPMLSPQYYGLQDCNGYNPMTRLSFLVHSWRENRFPIVLHTDNGPAPFFFRLGHQRIAEGSDLD